MVGDCANLPTAFGVYVLKVKSSLVDLECLGHPDVKGYWAEQAPKVERKRVGLAAANYAGRFVVGHRLVNGFDDVVGERPAEYVGEGNPLVSSDGCSWAGDGDDVS